jgi:DNA mismatch repair protein MSH2
MLYTKEEIEAGTRLMEEFFRAYAAEDGEDRMDGDAQLEHLRHCLERFRPQLESNPWCKTILAEL